MSITTIAHYQLDSELQEIARHYVPPPRQLNGLPLSPDSRHQNEQDSPVGAALRDCGRREYRRDSMRTATAATIRSGARLIHIPVMVHI